MTQFLLELGAEPIHILATNGTKPWAKKVQKLLDSSPFGKQGQGIVISGANVEALKNINKMVNRMGEPVIRRAMVEAMKVMGKQFVLGRKQAQHMFQKLSVGDSHGANVAFRN